MITSILHKILDFINFFLPMISLFCDLICLLQKLRETKNSKLEQIMVIEIIIKKCLQASRICSFAISSKQNSNLTQDDYKFY